MPRIALVFGVYSVAAPGAFFDTLVFTTVLLAIALRISISDEKVGVR